jgi:hypothetical protein
MAADKLARPVFTPTGFRCSSCGASLEPDASVCPDCGSTLAQDVQFAVPTAVRYNPDYLMIGWMWALTAAAAFAYAAVGPLLGGLVDIAPLIIAILLFARHHQSDRVNSVVKFVIDAITIVVSLVAAMTGAHVP